MPNVTIYTDGSCRGNPGPGGWAAILCYKDIKKAFSGSAKNTTNNKMELTAVIEGLRLLKYPCIVEVFTDSKYVKDGLKWMTKWKMNGWKTSSKRPVKNKELWLDLDALCTTHTVVFKYVPGHKNIPLNEEADRLAREESGRVANGL